MLAELFVPELREMYADQKGDGRDRTSSGYGLPKKNVDVDDAEVKAARRGWRRQDRSWESTRRRFSGGISRCNGSAREVQRTVVDPQILLESQNQWKVEHGRARRRQGGDRKGRGRVVGGRGDALGAKVTSRLPAPIWASR